MRAGGRTAAIAAAALLIGLLVAPSSSADPDVTDDDVADAQADVRSAASDVAQIELELALQQAQAEDAWMAVQAAGEDYTQAVVDRDTALAASDRAAQDAAAAAEEVEAARSELSAIALAAYRSGGAIDGLAALLSSDGFEDAVARSIAVDQLGERAQRIVQRFEAAQLVATTLQERADAAAEDAAAAATQAEQALVAAEAAQQAADEAVAAIAERREVLLAQLAAARQTSVEVERARQDQLDAERRAREDAAARAQHGVGTPSTPAAPPTPATPTPTTPGTPATPTTPTTPTTPPATPTTPPAPPATDKYGLGTGSQRGSAEQGAAAVAWAVAQVGKAYGWGATGPDAFDCSGLTSKAWSAAGLSINRTSRDQYRQVLKIAYDQMRPGDLIFWGSNGADPGSITHVAMYVGGGQMVEAPRPGVAVRVTAVRWSGTMPYAGRP